MLLVGATQIVQQIFLQPVHRRQFIDGFIVLVNGHVVEAHLLKTLSEIIQGRDTALWLAAGFLELLDGAFDVARLHVQRTEVEPVHEIVGVAFHETLGFEELELVQFGFERGDFVLKRRGVGRVGFQLFLLGVEL